MAGVAKFLSANPALYPLAAALTLGVGGGVAFGVHYLRNSPDVVVNKRTHDPWNKVKQGTNSKLFSFNQDFWKQRAGIPDPRMAFLDDIEKKDPAHRSAAQNSYLKRARALKAAQETQEK